jgi:hypothetical protein
MVIIRYLNREPKYPRPQLFETTTPIRTGGHRHILPLRNVDRRWGSTTVSTRLYLN